MGYTLDFSVVWHAMPALLRAARTLGCRTIDGGGMAIFQDTEAFRLFTGISPDPDVFFATFASLGG